MTQPRVPKPPPEVIEQRRQERLCVRCGRGPLKSSHDEHTSPSYRHGGRGLCTPCYMMLWDSGRLDEWPRNRLSNEEVCAKWKMFHRRGLTIQDLADHLEVPYHTVYSHLYRAGYRAT